MVGAVCGAAVVLAVDLLRKRDAGELARELAARAEDDRLKEIEAMLTRVRDAFGSLSLQALKANSEEFLKLADAAMSRQTQSGEKDLEGKKKLIDQSIESMRGDMRKMQDLVSSFEKDRAQKYGELAGQLRTASEQTLRLQETTEKLRATLASTKSRGQWGERMAEDVLRLAGFIEGVNYLKQKTLDSTASRPDFTFPLPNGQKINMDVKFPLSSYLRLQEARTDSEMDACKAQFLRDVRTRIKEVTGRNYINPDDQTLDYCLVFIPNEQIYAFINQNDPGLLDEALRNKVILCSPFTLYAMLAIIRQAMDNFSLERAADDMLRHMGSFFKEWGKFKEAMDKMGKKLDEARDEFGKLITTRTNKLERPLRKIEDIRKQKGIEAVIDLGELEADENGGPPALPEGRAADKDGEN